MRAIMLILPISTDNRLTKPPLVNYIIIAINFLVYFPVAVKGLNHASQESFFRPFMLHPEAPFLYQFITYGFLHGSWAHIIGNMFFLYLFGNNVNDKLGNRGYAIFYLAGCVFAGLGHAVMSSGPVLGASGAVAAVTGAYMVLFPMTRINVFYWIIFIGTLDVSALYFILFKLIIVDNFILTGDGVAYDAHIAGYVFGIGVTLILLHFKFLPRSQFDLWAMINRWKRRQEFRVAASKGYDPFSGIANKSKEPEIDSEKAGEIEQYRKKIYDAIYAGDLANAAKSYGELLAVDDKSVLPLQHQLDISNKLMQLGNYPQAATAYEMFLSKYASYPYIEQVELMLGLIYARYQARPDRARELLVKAQDRLTNEGQFKLCSDTLAALPQ